VNPNELMSSYMQEVQALAQKAEEAKKQLKELTGSLTGGDGAVSLTVNAAGALQSLSFGPRADEMPRAQLASLVLSTAKRAQIKAAQQVTSILAPIVGEDSDAMRFVQQQIPVPEEPDEGQDASDLQQRRFAYNEEQRDAYQSAPPAPAFGPQTPRFQPPPAPQSRPRRDDVDDDYSAHAVTREEDW
jgi:DNA-binding protein YbaB